MKKVISIIRVLTVIRAVVLVGVSVWVRIIAARADLKPSSQLKGLHQSSAIYAIPCSGYTPAVQAEASGKGDLKPGTFSHDLLKIPQGSSPDVSSGSEVTVSSGYVDAILIQDPYTQKYGAVWSTKPRLPDWEAMFLRDAADHHEFPTSYTNLTTKYLTTVNTADNLFSQGVGNEDTGPGMFCTTSADY
jgi:hypothetical protein